MNPKRKSIVAIKMIMIITVELKWILQAFDFKWRTVCFSGSFDYKLRLFFQIPLSPIFHQYESEAEFQDPWLINFTPSSSTSGFASNDVSFWWNCKCNIFWFVMKTTVENVTVFIEYVNGILLYSKCYFNIYQVRISF